VARPPALVDKVKSTSKSRVPYKSLAYYAVLTKLLTSTREEMEILVTKKTKSSIYKYSVTICFNGWNNVTHQPLMNVMLSCTNGEVFIRSIDTIVNAKTPPMWQPT